MARGDQIYVLRSLLNLDSLYEHHGIDCGDGSVIHYSKSGDEPEIRQTSLDNFAKGKPISRRDYPTAYIPETVIHRATSRLGERRYNLLFNNCEHFATWCKTGASVSKQVRDAAPLLATLDPTALDPALNDALTGGDRADAPQLLDRALADARALWESLQPRYKTARRDVQQWDRVAREALRRQREDLAKGAIARKLAAQNEAQRLQTELDRLAQSTETLVRNGQRLGIDLSRWRR